MPQHSLRDLIKADLDAMRVDAAIGADAALSIIGQGLDATQNTFNS